jgi:hypothetical protein
MKPLWRKPESQSRKPGKYGAIVPGVDAVRGCRADSAAAASAAAAAAAAARASASSLTWIRCTPSCLSCPMLRSRTHVQNNAAMATVRSIRALIGPS